jgi:quercetin dioxygenase-like cupin family protein
MDIEYNYFKNESEVLTEIEAVGYFPLTLDFPAESNEDHWHDFDSMVYILEGEITITEAETGESCTCGAGTKIMAPGGVLHREQTAGHKALIGFSIDPAELTQPVNKPPPVALG